MLSTVNETEAEEFIDEIRNKTQTFTVNIQISPFKSLITIGFLEFGKQHG